ncbi:Plasmodium exported protein (hyp12), unknown function [Plasmodium sp. gorilla clade G2]|uniref:Plasmodium exported protein (hyp12), unknown function n=1 Tax=Plasmodium sp. gorilla clade G2 TaxID=880535 RepID=UPI000D2995E9|nr:Plasmodium exported protein (hyp12), unknown function [Plasmodium sp. gorilla clade G2]SOV20059.1 Plasmodium exported protein (hyp12), unknown function [Plasmodium sp. gorilla clade G2]
MFIIQMKQIVFVILSLYSILQENNVELGSVKKENRIFNVSNSMPIRSLAEASVEKPSTHTKNKYPNESITNSSNSSAQSSTKATAEKSRTKSMSKRNEQVNKQTISRPTYNSILQNRQSSNDNNYNGGLQNVLQSYNENRVKCIVDTLDLPHDIKGKFKELLCLNVNRIDPNRQYKLYREIRKHIEKYEDDPMIRSIVDLENIEDDIYYLRNPKLAKHVVYDTSKENRRRRKMERLEKQKLKEEKKKNKKEKKDNNF